MCKPDSHLALHAEVELLAHVPSGVEPVIDRECITRAYERLTYHYATPFALTAQPHALAVIWCCLNITDEETGWELYHSAWVTKLGVNDIV